MLNGIVLSQKAGHEMTSYYQLHQATRFNMTLNNIKRAKGRVVWTIKKQFDPDVLLAVNNALYEAGYVRIYRSHPWGGVYQFDDVELVKKIINDCLEEASSRQVVNQWVGKIQEQLSKAGFSSSTDLAHFLRATADKIER